MKKLYKNDQTGRSMVEMLGVLAIIGVLSVGGIAGYSKAMGKFKVTKMNDQVTMLIANIRTAYANQNSFTGLDAGSAISADLIPSGMGNTVSKLKNAYGGAVTIANSTDSTTNVSSFSVSFSNIPTDACISALTSDWGKEGFLGMDVGTAAAGTPTKGTEAADLPLSLSDAVTKCGDSLVVLSWIYN